MHAAAGVVFGILISIIIDHFDLLPQEGARGAKMQKEEARIMPTVRGWVRDQVNGGWEENVGRWFGLRGRRPGDSYRTAKTMRAGWDRVRSTWMSVSEHIEDYDITFHQGGVVCSLRDWSAYVKPGLPNQIFLCSDYWGYPDAGQYDSKVGVIIHELTHSAAGTIDIPRTPYGCQILAKENPLVAVINAYNYEYQVEYNHGARN